MKRISIVSIASDWVDQPLAAAAVGRPRSKASAGSLYFGLGNNLRVFFTCVSVRDRACRAKRGTVWFRSAAKSSGRQPLLRRSRRDVVHPGASQPQAFRLEEHVHVKSNSGFSPTHAAGHVAYPSADAAEEVADVHYEQVWSFQGCKMAAAVEV